MYKLLSSGMERKAHVEASFAASVSMCRRLHCLAAHSVSHRQAYIHCLKTVHSGSTIVQTVVNVNVNVLRILNNHTSLLGL